LDLKCAHDAGFVHCGCTGLAGRLEVLDLSNMSPAVTRLALTDNELTSLGPNCLVGGEEVQAITLTHNNMTAVPSNSFSNIPKLATVDYSYNHIDRLGPAVINCTSNYPSLERVNLVGNPVVYVQQHAVVNCVKLTSFEQGDVPSHCPTGSYVQLQRHGNSTSVVPINVRMCKCTPGQQCLDDDIQPW
jgi:hypothetical protein